MCKPREKEKIRGQGRWGVQHGAVPGEPPPEPHRPSRLAGVQVCDSDLP